MPIPFRRELQSFLAEYAEEHRGVRLGYMFGLPAIYAGRRLVSCLIEEGIIIRLPLELAREEIRSRRGVPYNQHSRRTGNWVLYTPKSAGAARALVPIVERATRYQAERQTEEITGVRRRSRS
jgi:hypothetical protein